MNLLKITLFIISVMLMIPSMVLKELKEPSAYAVFEKDGFTVIKTPAVNIKPETVKSPLCSDYIKELGYYGVNGGFFNDVYFSEPPEGELRSSSVSWSKYDEEMGKENCGRNRSEWDGPHVPWGTLYMYCENNKYYAGVVTVKNTQELIEKIGAEKDYIYMIGGGNFHLKEYPEKEDSQLWKSEKYLQEGPIVSADFSTGRTGIGIKEENGIWYLYIAVSAVKGEESYKKLEELRNLFIEIGCSDALYLDGAGSSQARYIDNDGKIIEKQGDKRYIWSMIRLINVIPVKDN